MQFAIHNLQFTIHNLQFTIKLISLCIVHCALCIGMASATTVIRDTEIEHRIFEITTVLAKSAGIPNDRLKIHIISDGKFNATTGGGLEIQITTGLLTQIESFAELSAVLAHELGHIELGHIAQLRAKVKSEAIRNVAVQMLGVGVAAAYSAQAGMGVMAGSVAMSQQSMMAFSREEERAADDYATNLLIKAGINPGALLSVFEKMQNDYAESKANPHNRSHPLTEERIKNIKSRIDGKSQKKKADANLDLMQAKLIGYLDSPSRIRTLYPESNSKDAALYARAIARTKAGDLAGAKTETLTLISRNKKNPYFYELLGDIEFKFGHFDDSVRAYEESLKLVTVAAPQIEMALALVLSMRKKPGDFERATTLAKKTILVEKMPLAFWILAQVDEAKSDYYLAEYHYLNRNMKTARAHAKSAIKKLPKDSPEYLKAEDIVSEK